KIKSKSRFRMLKKTRDLLKESEKRRELKTEEEKKEEKYMLFGVHKKIISLDKYPGSLEGYISMKGGSYKPIDIGKPEKSIIIRNYVETDRYRSHNKEEIRSWGLYYKKLLEQGLCGFIHWKGWENHRSHLLVSLHQEYYLGEGVPIKKVLEGRIE
ncbi:unnamed protein product, partial [marine sediment metagenome]